MASGTRVVSAAIVGALAAAAFPSKAAEIRVGEPFPDLVLPRMSDGGPASPADFRGERVVLHVFASW